MWSVRRVLLILCLALILTVLLCDHQVQAVGGAHAHSRGRHVSRARLGGFRRFGRRHYGFGYRKQARRGYTWGPPGPRNAGKKRSNPGGSLVIFGGFSDGLFLWPYGR